MVRWSLIVFVFALFFYLPVSYGYVTTEAYQLAGCETLGAPPAVYVTITSYSRNKNEIPGIVVACDVPFTLRWLGNPYQTPTLNSWDAMLVGLYGDWVVSGYVTSTKKKKRWCLGILSS